jgi:uncharacterized protein YbaR (Trm112 family)
MSENEQRYTRRSGKKVFPPSLDGRIEDMDKKLLALLACPVCKNGLTYDTWLICPVCHKKFEIRNNVPVLIIEQALEA